MYALFMDLFLVLKMEIINIILCLLVAIEFLDSILYIKPLVFYSLCLFSWLEKFDIFNQNIGAQQIYCHF